MNILDKLLNYIDGVTSKNTGPMSNAKPSRGILSEPDIDELLEEADRLIDMFKKIGKGA